MNFTIFTHTLGHFFFLSSEDHVKQGLNANLTHISRARNTSKNANFKTIVFCLFVINEVKNMIKEKRKEAQVKTIR